MKLRILSSTAVAVVALLAACGGNKKEDQPKTATPAMYVVGDDQGDVGTYGFKFTVQDANNPAGFPTFSELVAASLKAPALCPYYSGTNGSQTFVVNPDCNNYALAGGRVNYQPSFGSQLRNLPTIGGAVDGVAPVGSPADQVLGFVPGLGSVVGSLPLVGATITGLTAPAAQQLPDTTGQNSPLSVVKQLETLGARGVGPKDLVVVIAASNDAADLATAYLQYDIDQGTAFKSLVGTLGVTEADPVVAGNLYMQRLADRLYSAVDAHLLAKGVTKVALFNLLNITQAPRLTQARQTIAGAEARVPVLLQWVNTYNRQLAANIGTNKAIIPIDYFKLVNDGINDKNLLVANTTTPACPQTGTGTLDNLPTYDLRNCTNTLLSDNPPEGETGPDWWKRYFFADSTHPTPYLHNLLARGVNLELVRAGLL